ncbi:PIN domain-containing protein [Microbacterium sp. MYb64]|uniref:PIN domain-containing protein n=1 Tax=Microbacterium sp. MYb64 TaxID=1848691 RepID=UPI000CFE3333|nr:type II toxin-antitoxin system VapC family toxin [Microbacterium sp. MYb64]PRB04345.1 VapC toxin family PIN domain ribonuclease [Microbacterium sp. MYb64]
MLVPHAMTGIDTNVILRAALDDDPVQSRLAQELLESLTREAPGFVTMVTLAEVFWIVRSREGFSKDTALALIRGLVESDVLEFDDGEGVVRALEAAGDGADFADALIDSTMAQFGVTETVTFDRRAAQRLGWRLLEG